MRWVLVCVVGCYTPHPLVLPRCATTQAPVALDEITSLGFSADDLITQLETEQSRWTVTWPSPRGRVRRPSRSTS